MEKMEDWKTLKLGEIAEVIDCPHSTPKWTEKGVFVIRSWNVRNGRLVLDKQSFTDEQTYRDRIKRAIPTEGDIVLTREAPMGELCMIPTGLKCCIGQRIVLLKVNKTIDNVFLLYSLQSPIVQKRIKASEGTGSTVSNFRIPDIKALELSIPKDINKQRSIASILSSLDEKIELNLQMNRTLEAIAQAIFKEWFVDFRFPGFDGELMDGLPKGWRKLTLGENFNITMGQSPPGESYNDTRKGTIFFQGRTDFGFRFPENRMYTTSPNRLARKLDTIVSVRAPVGDINMAGEDCCIGRGLSSVRHNSGAYSYTYYTMKSLENIFNGFDGEGTIFGSISKSNFENISIVAPDEDIIMRFESVVNTLDEKIFNNSKEIRTLTEIRDTLLPMLMTGKINVC